jgi:hypothetical protein
VDQFEKLSAIEEIKALKGRYCRFLDTKQWRQWEQLFVPDLVTEFPDDRPEAPPFRGRRDFVQGIEVLLGPALTVHHVHTPEIEITGGKAARGIWAMHDIIRYPKSATLPNDGRNLIGWGHYHETYVNSAEGWRIETLKLTRLKVDYP